MRPPAPLPLFVRRSLRVVLLMLLTPRCCWRLRVSGFVCVSRPPCVLSCLTPLLLLPCVARAFAGVAGVVPVGARLKQGFVFGGTSWRAPLVPGCPLKGVGCTARAWISLEAFV